MAFPSFESVASGSETRLPWRGRPPVRGVRRSDVVIFSARPVASLFDGSSGVRTSLRATVGFLPRLDPLPRTERRPVGLARGSTGAISGAGSETAGCGVGGLRPLPRELPLPLTDLLAGRASAAGFPSPAVGLPTSSATGARAGATVGVGAGPSTDTAAGAAPSSTLGAARRPPRPLGARLATFFFASAAAPSSVATAVSSSPSAFCARGRVVFFRSGRAGGPSSGGDSGSVDTSGFNVSLYTLPSLTRSIKLAS